MQMREKAVISDERHLKWWPTPFWIYYFSRFWSHDLFPVANSHIPAKFYKPFQSAADLLCFALKKQNGGRRHVKFHFCSILWYRPNYV